MRTKTILGPNFQSVLPRFPTALGNVYCGAFIGEGWFPHVVKALEVLERLGVEVHQIKEKFGGLRIYVGEAPEEAYNAIHKAEDACAKICENCGSPAEYKDAWSGMLCKKCR